MDAARAIADLTEISSQIESVALFDAAGSVAGSTFADEAAASAFAAASLALLGAADAVGDGERLTQLEAETVHGSVFVVRDGDMLVAATAGRDPTVGLVFYDLKSCLSAAREERHGKKRAPANARVRGATKAEDAS